MTNTELTEILSLLGQASLNPQLCNTAVHLSNSPARCGLPTLPGDDSPDGYVLLPRELVGQQPELFVPARGDSMIDAGFEEGDLLRMRLNTAAHDGDVVVASVDGGITVKVLFTDDSGHRWLVPRNERYDAIALTPESDVRLLGVIVGVEKSVVRASSGDCLRAIRRTMARRRQEQPPTAAQVAQTIMAVAAEVANSRQWYAVYRALADRRAVAEGCYADFCRRVALAVPEHAHLPQAKELGRMAVLSFRRRVALWDAADAPVRGARFAEYCRIAQLTAQYVGQ